MLVSWSTFCIVGDWTDMKKKEKRMEQVRTQRGKHAQTTHTRKDAQPQQEPGHAGLRHNKMPSHTHHSSTDFTSSMVPSGNKDAAGLPYPLDGNLAISVKSKMSTPFSPTCFYQAQRNRHTGAQQCPHPHTL